LLGVGGESRGRGETWKIHHKHSLSSARKKEEGKETLPGFEQVLQSLRGAEKKKGGAKATKLLPIGKGKKKERFFSCLLADQGGFALSSFSKKGAKTERERPPGERRGEREAGKRKKIVTFFVRGKKKKAATDCIHMWTEKKEKVEETISVSYLRGRRKGGVWSAAKKKTAPEGEEKKRSGT